jgi:HEAT repeat protein
MLWWTLRQLKSSDPAARIKAVTELGEAKQGKAVPDLVKILQDENPEIRLAVIHALGTIGHPAAAEPLASALVNTPGTATSRTEAEYQSIAQALAAVGVEAVKSLVQVLSANDKEARRWAASALGRIKDPNAMDPLSEKLEDNRSDVRKAAALALGEIGDSRAVPALVRALSNRDMETRRAAAEALGSIDSDSGITALIKAVGDSSEPVQVAAIRSLSKIGGLSAASCLRAAMSGPRKAVSDAAEAALTEMRFSPSSPEQRAEMAVLRGHFEAALCEGPAALPALASALQLKDPKMRVKAAEALAALASGESVQPLVQALKDHNTTVQESSARALAKIGDAARPGLEDSLSYYDASVVRLSAAVLGEIGDTRSIPPLASLIESNRVVPGDNPDLFEAVLIAVNSLTRIFSTAGGKVSRQDLELVAGLPEEVSLAGPDPKVLDCRGLLQSASEELARR